MKYQGIELTQKTDVRLSHSRVLQAISNEEQDNNIEYLQLLGNINCSKVSPEVFEEISNVFTFSSANYQICNGGVKRYYDNGYANGIDPHDSSDCSIYTKRGLVEFISNNIIPMAEAIYGADSKQVSILKSLNSLLEGVYQESNDRGYNDPYDEDEDDGDDDGYVYGAEPLEDLWYDNTELIESMIEMYAEYVYKKYDLQTTAA